MSILNKKEGDRSPKNIRIKVKAN